MCVCVCVCVCVCMCVCVCVNVCLSVCYHLTKMTRQEDQKHIFNFAWPYVGNRCNNLIEIYNIISVCLI